MTSGAYDGANRNYYFQGVTTLTLLMAASPLRRMVTHATDGLAKVLCCFATGNVGNCSPSQPKVVLTPGL